MKDGYHTHLGPLTDNFRRWEKTKCYLWHEYTERHIASGPQIYHPRSLITWRASGITSFLGGSHVTWLGQSASIAEDPNQKRVINMMDLGKSTARKLLPNIHFTKVEPMSGQSKSWTKWFDTIQLLWQQRKRRLDSGKSLPQFDFYYRLSTKSQIHGDYLSIEGLAIEEKILQLSLREWFSWF